MLTEARDLLERMAAEPGFAALAGARVTPADFDIRARVVNYCHPAGTCSVGTVVRPDGQVHGIDGLYVADASVMPTITRGNPNLPVAAIAARIAAGLGGFDVQRLRVTASRTVRPAVSASST